MLSREELIKRGARTKGGAPLDAKKEETSEQEKVSSVVGDVKIDATPIADAVHQLSEVVKGILEAQKPLLEKIIERQPQVVEPKKAPEEWDFTIERDARGKMTKIRAVAVG